MTIRSTQLQIRVTPREKAVLKRLAAAAGKDVSKYVLAKALPGNQVEFGSILRSLENEGSRRFALAELNDFLTGLSASELIEAVASAGVGRLAPFVQNYVAAMVEQAAYERDVDPPGWVADIEPLATPWFAAPLIGLRPHLLRASPVPFKRRNLFVDSALGARV
ncbi:MAG: plasmid mobilization protein [Longimicrobiales bacterium]